MLAPLELVDNGRGFFPVTLRAPACGLCELCDRRPCVTQRLPRFTSIAATMRQLPMKNAMKIDLKGMSSRAAWEPILRPNETVHGTRRSVPIALGLMTSEQWSNA